MGQGISLKSEINSPWFKPLFNILLHTQSIVFATADSQCLEYLETLGWAFIWIEGISIVIFIWYPTAPNMYRFLFSRIKIWAKINVVLSKQFFKVNSELQGDRMTFLAVS